MFFRSTPDPSVESMEKDTCPPCAVASQDPCKLRLVNEAVLECVWLWSGILRLPLEVEVRSNFPRQRGRLPPVVTSAFTDHHPVRKVWSVQGICILTRYEVDPFSPASTAVSLLRPCRLTRSESTSTHTVTQAHILRVEMCRGQAFVLCIAEPSKTWKVPMHKNWRTRLWCRSR